MDEAEDLQIEGWLEALDSRTRESAEHIYGVTDATVALAIMAGVPESELVQIRRGALLHDIGKIGIPDAILLKSDKLTAEAPRSSANIPSTPTNCSTRLNISGAALQSRTHTMKGGMEQATHSA